MERLSVCTPSLSPYHGLAADVCLTSVGRSGEVSGWQIPASCAAYICGKRSMSFNHSGTRSGFFTTPCSEPRR